MLAELYNMPTSIMQKNYSHCPLKKRPVKEVTIPKEEYEDNSEPENLSTKPEDLSRTGRYPKNVSPASSPEPEPRKESPAYYNPTTSYLKGSGSPLEPLNLNTPVDPSYHAAAWPRSLMPQYPHYLPFGYPFEGYTYAPVFPVSPSRSSEQLSPYAPRDNSCSPPHTVYASGTLKHPVATLPHRQTSRWTPYSVDQSSLSPTSSHNSFQSHSPPLATPEDLSSPGSVNSEHTLTGTKKRKDPAATPRYQCPDCGKSYSTYSGLSKHQQFHCAAAEGNQAKKSFSCKYCEKVYVSLGALKMHIRTHTLPCKCHLCGKAFSRPWLLQGHIRTHTGEKPFSCQHCHRAFADRSNLRAHLQTHSDVKKYSCVNCSKTFSRMSLLTKHMDGGCPGNGAQIQAYPGECMKMEAMY